MWNQRYCSSLLVDIPRYIGTMIKKWLIVLSLVFLSLSPFPSNTWTMMENADFDGSGDLDSNDLWDLYNYLAWSVGPMPEEYLPLIGGG